MHNKKNRWWQKIEIPWYSVLFYFLLLWWDPSVGMLLTMGSAFLHEWGHYGMAQLLRVRVEWIKVYPFGADMRLSPGLHSYGADLLIALAGAAVNLLLAGIGSALHMDILVACNVLLAVVNLLPVAGLDGGVILLAVVGSRGGRGEGILRATSFVCLFLLWLAAVYILFVTDGDPSLFVLACGLFASIFLRGKRTRR